MATTTRDQRGIPQAFGGETYAAPLSYGGVRPEDYRAIASIPWFSRIAFQAYSENYFEQLALYAWDGPFYWGVKTEALSTRVWRDIIAVADNEMCYYGSAESKRTRQVAEVAKGMLALAGGPLVEEDVDVDIWRYRYYGKRPYMANLCALQAERFQS